jgi:hypothetical protein
LFVLNISFSFVFDKFLRLCCFEINSFGEFSSFSFISSRVVMVFLLLYFILELLPLFSIFFFDLKFLKLKKFEVSELKLFKFISNSLGFDDAFFYQIYKLIFYLNHFYFF